MKIMTKAAIVPAHLDIYLVFEPKALKSKMSLLIKLKFIKNRDIEFDIMNIFRKGEKADVYWRLDSHESKLEELAHSHPYL